MNSKHLVEEYMLLANVLIAEFIKPFCGPKTLLRAHADMDEDKKIELREFFNKIGMQGNNINLTNSTTLSNSMETLRYSKDPEDIAKFNVAVRAIFGHLEAAKYVTINDHMKSPDKFSHYGLNFPEYTHFTSPIRRYADLLVHRLTTICLEHGPKTGLFIEKIDYSQYAENCSEKSLNSKRASKACQRLFHCLLLQKSGA